MKSFYASDEIVRRINNGGRALSRAHYVYSEEEAQERFSAIVREINWMIKAISDVLNLQGEVVYSLVASRSPFQVSRLEKDTFAILLDQRAVYFWLKLCLRIQSLPPAADELGIDSIEEKRNYTGLYLLDITKDIVFHTEDISYLLASYQYKGVYQAGLCYIIAHEIAHVAHGHLDFLASNEFSLFCKDIDDENLTRRTLEMDADSSATTSVFDAFERYVSVAGNIATKENKNFASEKFEVVARKQYIYSACTSLIFLSILWPRITLRRYIL